MALSYPFEQHVNNSLVVREPLGVAVAITPWNYPLHQIAAKVAPALAAGCTVVLKPSEVAPLNAYILAEVFGSIGLPPGVFNLLTGTGAEVGEALVAHPDVDKVSFTGSTGAGRRIGSVAAETIKRVGLELGGKSPLIILDDADLVEAVGGGLSQVFVNSGQTCIALSRMIVPRSKLAEVEAIAKAGAESIIVGNPFDPATQMGPPVSALQRDRGDHRQSRPDLTGKPWRDSRPQAAVHLVRPGAARCHRHRTVAAEPMPSRFGSAAVLLGRGAGRVALRTWPLGLPDPSGKPRVVRGVARRRR